MRTPIAFFTPFTTASLAAALLLSACGGGSGADPSPGGDAAIPAVGVQLVAEAPAAEPVVAGPVAAVPAAVVAPEGWTPPEVPAEAPEIVALDQLELQPLHAVDEADAMTPLVSYLGNAGPYAPQDWRGAYSFPALPAKIATATAAQKAALGAGQTVYIVVAYHQPALVSWLNTAAQRFGLPACTQATIDNRTALPLAAAPTTGCTISVVGADANGNVAALPAANTTWGVEEAMDTQLVHAGAPLARIVVVAAQGADLASMNGAISLVNRMGNGVLSMSFGTGDRSAFGMLDTLFKRAGMLYVASSGDAGYNGGTTSWPAAVPTVLSVGGTTLRWDGATRSEAAWSLGGGGPSTWRPAPAYQLGYSVKTTAGVTVSKNRMLPDVALNADANTGYLVYANAGAGPTWLRAGGTSASGPIWGAMVATANAMRKAGGKAALASVHDVMYRTVGATSVVYKSNMWDVTTGSNGTCLTCKAGTGYDLATGLGSPRSTASLLSTLVAAAK